MDLLRLRVERIIGLIGPTSVPDQKNEPEMPQNLIKTKKASILVISMLRRAFYCIKLEF